MIGEGRSTVGGEHLATGHDRANGQRGDRLGRTRGITSAGDERNGERLRLKLRTVTSHLEQVFARLGVRSRTELARFMASGRGRKIDAAR